MVTILLGSITLLWAVLAIHVIYGMNRLPRFSDAEVRVEPKALRRAMALVRRYQCDHLIFLGAIDVVGFWEKVAISYFVAGFIVGVQPWRVSDPYCGCYMGVGMFQLVR